MALWALLPDILEIPLRRLAGLESEIVGPQTSASPAIDGVIEIRDTDRASVFTSVGKKRSNIEGMGCSIGAPELILGVFGKLGR